MITLNLKTKNGSQCRIKEYLEQHANPALAEKINNGTRIEKDGKTLINKKDLDGFWAYACRKSRENGDDYTENETVFEWAMYYFNEDTIEGTLYNENGTKYKPIKNVTVPVPAPVVQEKPKPKKAQISLFDMMETDDKTDEETVEEVIDETPDEEAETDMKIDKETGEIISPVKDKKTVPFQQLSPLYQKYIGFQRQYPQAVIAYRLGDFFEVFGDNAIMLANEIELTLTGRDCGLDERVPMVGFPYHASDNYFKKIAETHQLVVVEDNTATLYRTPIEEPETDEIDETDETELAELRERSKAFESSALCKLIEIFGDELTIQEEDI
ncbi:MAG: hypothetical protein IJY05_00105 [Clostridia bacterium]|nr:hypothetical protein [Clostridia bacterium]